MTVTVGVHASNPSLYYLSRLGYLEEELAPLGETVSWHRYTNGVATGQLLAEGVLDFGGTGSTPPITAQADGHDIVYTAVSAPRPDHGALLVTADGPAQSIADLRGGTVALAIGSWQTHFVAKALHAEGLAYGVDVTPKRSESGEADRLAAGEIQGWVAQGAELQAALRSGDFRVLLRSGEVISDRSVFFSRRDFAEQSPELVSAVVRALRRVDAWGAAQAHDAAAIAAEDLGGSEADWYEALSALPWKTEEVGDAFLAEQQEAADILHSVGFVSRPVKIADAVPAAHKEEN